MNSRMMVPLPCLCLALAAGAPLAQVQITVGPTPIPGGDALGARDITLSNERLAVAFAVQTAPPWGVARGGIVDVAQVRDGVIAHDRASLVDFMPDDWSGWPSTYQRVLIEKNTPEEVVVRSERDWGSAELVTWFSLKAGEDRLHLLTRMKNTGDTATGELLSGYVMYPRGGALSGLPGTVDAEKGEAMQAIASWSAAYDADWVMGLHAPFADHFGHRGRDRYLRHALAAGDSREFEAWLQVGASGELAPLVRAEIALRGLPSARITGHVRASDGSAVERAAVIVERESAEGWQLYTWALADGDRYRLDLPPGRYRLWASAPGHGGSSPSTLQLRGGEELRQDFGDVNLPGELALEVRETGGSRALDARISIEEGEKPPIAWFGRNTFFTGLADIGFARMRLAPGRYRLKVAHAEGFRARAAMLEVQIEAGKTQQARVDIALAADPASRGWYGGDMHHHSDVLDGFTDPEFVMRSELAAGLDVTLLSDHDSVINNEQMSRLAAMRSLPFIPATELSPSWAHFNAYPLDAGARIGIDTGRSSVQQIFAEARRMGADVVQVNHPYNNYGYFYSQSRNAVPGGYSDAFDLVEMGARIDNEQTLRHAWRLWNAGQRAYLSAGSDVHDVWRDVSGEVRMYVKLDAAPDVASFVAALKRGRAFASQGPLVYPRQMFGETLRCRPGSELTLGYALQAVNGLKSVSLIERGEVLASREFAGEETAVDVEFSVRPQADGWYALVVEDAADLKAWTNPVWVNVD